jgi:phage gp36-like protein
MGFATRADLLARANARRLAQLAVPADTDFPQSDRALRRAIEGEDLSDLSEADRAAVDLALDAIDKCIVDADALLISYGIPPDVRTALLARLSSTVALYYLQGAERMTEAQENAYKAVLSLLDRYRKGELPGLLPDDPDAPAASDGFAVITSAPRRYR